MTKDEEHRVGEYIPMLEQKQNPYYLATHMGEGWQDGFDGKPVRSTFDGYKLGYVEGNTARKALAEPEQPKVRTGNCLRVGVCASEGHKIAPQRTWVGLTDGDLEAEFGFIDELLRDTCYRTEAKLKEKNT